MSGCLPPNETLSRHRAIEILSSETLLNWCAQSSYLHSNGFSKILLSSHPNHGTVRLHHWEGQTQADDTHSHRWDFSSIVLHGNFQETVYEVEAGTGAIQYRYARQGLDGELTDGQEVSIRELSTFPASTRGRVHRKAGAFHRLACVSSDGGMTLVRTNRPHMRHSHVVRNAELGSTVKPAERVPTAELREILGILVEMDT